MAMIFELPPQAKANEASTLGYTGRLRKLAFDMNNAFAAELRAGNMTMALFEDWRDGYYSQLKMALAIAWGKASVVSRTGDFPGNVPPWFDADGLEWDGSEVKFPLLPSGKELHIGARMSFAFRLGEIIDFAGRDDEDRFAKAMASEKIKCENDTFWDDKIIWPQ
jgi:hypothetical protein